MWYMTEERQLLQQTVRAFVQQEVKTRVESMENGEYPRELVKKFGEAGILGLCADEEYGGTGRDYINLGIALEEIARESIPATMIAALASDMTVGMIHPYCTPDQIERFVKPALRGDIVLGLWSTEPCGLFNMMEYQTTAKLEGDEWVVNGGKIFASNCGINDYAIVVCKTAEAFDPVTFKGLSFIMVPTDAPGFKVGHIENKLGWHGTNTGQVYFNDVRVPKDNLIGPVDCAAQIILANNTKDYSLYGALSLGAAESVYEKTRKFVAEREQMGRSLWDSYQSVREKLAWMWAKIENFRGALYTCFEMQNRGESMLPQAVALKVEGVKLMEEVINDCMVLHGGIGLVKETGIERFYRDAKMCEIGCGSNFTLMDILSRYI